MTYLYWCLALPTGFLAGLVIVMTLAGQRLGPTTPGWLALAAASAVLGLLVSGFRLATAGGRPGIGVLLVVLSWAVFAGAMIAHGLMTQKLWN